MKRGNSTNDLWIKRYKIILNRCLFGLKTSPSTEVSKKSKSTSVGILQFEKAKLQNTKNLQVNMYFRLFDFSQNLVVLLASR